MTQTENGKLPRFHPCFLGDKFPTLDYLVELVEPGSSPRFFFVQVKTTRKGYTKRGRRLKVEVSLEDVRRLIQHPAPVYVVGIDERGKSGYIISLAGREPRPIASLPTLHPLTEETLRALWDEVKAFWDGRDKLPRSSRFGVED